MRLTHPPPALLALLLATLATAVPYPRDSLRDHGFGYLMSEECSEYCGTDNEVCCSAGETCYTSSGVPSCTSVSPLLAERDLVTTWTETHTYTSTISSWFVPTTTAGVGADGAPCIPVEGTGQIACGPICCADFQYCAHSGQCVANPGYSTWSEWITTGVYVTTQFSAPYRPTSSGPTATQTGPSNTFASATESATNTSPAAVSTTSSSLSAGAIAGIVVGTIAGVILLLLLCFCCIARGLWHAFVGIFGGKKKRRGSERVEIIEEHYSRHGSAAARPAHRTWFGGGGAAGGGRPSTVASRKEKKKSGGGLGWLFAAAGAIALVLGLRRGDKRKGGSQRPSRSDWSSSYYSDSYTATSPSSFSSDRRTRRSRQSRASRVSRHSRGTRASTRPSRI